MLNNNDIIMKKLSFHLLLTFSVTTLFAQSWKPAAQDSILKYRTTPLSIEVVNESGEPLEGVSVHVKLIKHQFKWGTTVNVNEVSKILGNKGTFNTNSKYINHFQLFNSVTPENAGKWKGWIDASQRATYLRTIEWLDSEGIANRGHTCVWESERFNAIPDILIGQTDTTVVRAEVKKHITNNMSTLSDKIYEMDVVNELVHEQHIVNDLLNVPDPALEHSQWYKWAKQAAPDVDLVANEFDLFQSGNNFYLRYIEYVEKMIADGAPVDGVGMQGHFWTDMPTYEELKRRINQVKQLGLPMSVTEFDMKGNSYADMERVMYAVFSEPQIYGFTMWGAWDGSQWRNNGPLFEENWDLKPSGMAWIDLVHGKWSNDTMAVTNAEGKFEINAYKGTHLIQIFKEGKVFTDTIEILDEKLELTYSDRVVKSLIPTGSLLIDGNNNEFNVYQPANLLVESNYPDSILKVEFFSGLFMQHRDTSADFSYEVISSSTGSRDIYAKITCKNGYSFLTDTVKLIFVNKNAFPTIIKTYPFINQFIPYGSDVTVACEVSDYENQLWKAELRGYKDTVLTDTTVPFQFILPAPEPKSYLLELKVLDSLHGFTTKTISFTVFQPDEELLKPEPPENLKITSKSGNELSIDWDPSASPDVLGYFIYIDGKKYDQFGTTYTRFTLELPDQQQHQVYVTAMNRFSQESDPGNTVNSDDENLDVTTNIFSETSIYPNPFSTEIYIDIPVTIGSSLMIYNQSGQLVKELNKTDGNEKHFIWNGTDNSGEEVPAGVYFIKSSNSDGSIFRKVIKIK